MSIIVRSQTGQPFIQNYPPHKYKGGTQIWTVLQDNRGVMYFGGNDGIYEYDGTEWRKIKLKAEDISVRSADIDQNGRIYIGSDGEFGFLKPDKKSELKYESLSCKLDSVDKSFSDIWSTASYKNTAYFCANNSLFIYNQDSSKKIKVIKPDKRFFLMHKVRNEIFVYSEGQGMMKIVNDTLQKVNGGNKFWTMFMIPFGKDKFLIGNSQNGLQIFNPKAEYPDSIVGKFDFNKTEISKTDSFLRENQLYHAAFIGKGRYALATIRAGIVIIDNTGKILSNINKQKGLLSNTVHFLYSDKQNGLWAGLTYGISRLEINSPLSLFNEKNGIQGSIYNSVRFEKNIYVSSNLGLFVYDNKNNAFTGIKKLSGKDAIQVFGLDVFKFPGSKNKKFIVSATSGTWEIKNKKANLISKSTSFVLYQSPSDSSKIYGIDDMFLICFTFKNNNRTKTDTILQLDNYSSIACENEEGDMWIIIEDKPALVKFNKKGKAHIKNFESNEITNVKFFTAEYIDNEVKFLTDDGFWLFDKNKEIFFPDTIFLKNKLRGKKIIQFDKISKNTWLALLKENEKLFLAKIKNYNNNLIFDTVPFKRINEFESFCTDGDSIAWIIAPNSLFRFDIKYKTSYTENSQVLIRKIISGTDSILYFGAEYVNQISDKNIHELEYKNNNITFKFSLPSFNNESKNLFSSRLIGDKNLNWSEWSSDTKKEYTNLYEGTYEFQIRAKNIYGFQSKISTFKFSVLPPWYRTFWAYGLYLILFVLLVWILIKLNTKRLVKEKEHLEEIVKERTAEIFQQKEEIQTQADNLFELNEKMLVKNNELIEKNKEINQQREEIQTIADNLIQTNSKLSEASKEIKLQNKNITDSITYAKRIQKAVLSKPALLSKNFPENFIWLMPKDIVSGDFYWFRQINNIFAIAAVDCTGHGVPGAFMSMLASAFMNEILLKREITQTGQALDNLRDLIKETLKQSDDFESQKDGLDIALCALNTDTLKMQYSGAHNPLYIIRNKKLIEYKADKMPVGYSRKEKNFITNTVQLETDDMLYIFSDGYVDQFGGERGRKFSHKNFKILLQEISKLPVKKQKQILKEKFSIWKGNKYLQMDDVLVMGIKIPEKK